MKFDPQQYAGRVAVADGGWSTILRLRGAPAPLAELANTECPHLVAALAREFLAAGAEILTTNTFAANPLVLKARGIETGADRINAAGVEVARAAIGDRPVPLVGVMGPSGKILAVNEAPESDVADSFRAHARTLATAGADAICLETFSELAELLLAIRSAREAVELPLIACMSFDSGPQRTRTVMGTEAADAAAALREAGADVVGTNCGGGVAHALAPVVALRANMPGPLWVKPSIGLPDLVEGELRYPQTPEEFCEPVPNLLEAGANIIGGCCGVGPEHIKRLAAIVASRRRRGESQK